MHVRAKNTPGVQKDGNKSQKDVSSCVSPLETFFIYRWDYFINTELDWIVNFKL